MKRDLDLVRHILLETEKADKPFDAEELLTSEWSLETIHYHVSLLVSQDLIDVSIIRDMSGEMISCTIKALTWNGCDYLDAIREPIVWTKTKKVLKETVGDTTLATIKETAVMVATSMIKGYLGL